MTRVLNALCPQCGLPAEMVTMRSGGFDFPLIGCPCAIERPVISTTRVVLMTTNHDPGDEDR